MKQVMLNVPVTDEETTKYFKEFLEKTRGEDLGKLDVRKAFKIIFEIAATLMLIDDNSYHDVMFKIDSLNAAISAAMLLFVAGKQTGEKWK